MLYFGTDVPTIIAFLFVAVLAFAYHEFAHAIVADYLGDPTPRSYGRITLNPFVHLDAFGMIMLAVAGFGWASTPVNPNKLRGNPRQSHAIVAVAGPLANILMAILWAIPIRFDLIPISLPNPDATFQLPTLFLLCSLGVRLNLLLFAFNLMPIPPLDGFTILTGILPPELAYRLMPIREHGTLILLAVIFILPMIGFDVLGWFLAPVMNNILPVLTGL